MGKKNTKKKDTIPPDEHRCSKTNGKEWRCKNFRMVLGAAADGSIPKTNRCEKHSNYSAKANNQLLKITRGDGEGAGSRVSKRRRKEVIKEEENDETCNPDVGTKRKKEMEKKKKLPPDEQYCCHTSGKGGYRCKNFRMSRGAAADDDNVPNTKFCERHYNYYKNLKKRSGDGEGCSTATGPVEIRRSKRRKAVTEEDETGEVLPATSDDTANTIIEGRGSAKIGTKKEKVQKLTIREPVAELESLEHYKNKCFELRVELEKQKVQLEKKNVEFAILRDKYAELESRKTAAKAEDAVEYWRNKCSDLETLVLKMETENPTMQWEVARISNLESLVPRNGKENSILRCEGMRTYEKVESEGRGLQNDTTESGKHHEPESEFPKQSAVSICSGSLQLASGGENDEEGRPFQHGSSSQDHSKMTFVNLVSDSDDESEEPLDMLAPKNWNRNKREMRWKSEADMLSWFEADPVLCMRAVCALYRQEISEDERSPKGLVIDSDTLRCTTLAKFLMGEDCKGDLKKSVAELEKFDSNAVSDCNKLVRRYSVYLFDIYENRKDPFFLPATTARNGDQIAE